MMRRLKRREFLKMAGIGGGALMASNFTGLVPNAWAQGKVLHYASGSSGTTKAIMDAFTKKTGIPAQFWRSGAMKVIQKFEAEVEAKRMMTNLVSVANVGAALRWAEKGYMEPYDSPVASHFDDRYKIGNSFIVQKLMTAVIVYNTDMVKESDAPKHWSDVLDPKYKNMMVMHDARYSGSATHFIYGMTKLLGKGFISQLAKNNVMLKRGGGATMNTIVAGERPIGIGVPEYHFFKQAKKGAPVRAIYPEEGTTALNFYLGIPKGAPDMDAAKKAFDFSLSKKMQQMWQDKFGIPVARDDMPPFNDKFRKWGLKPFKELNTFASTLEDFIEEARIEKALKKEYQMISG
jgi:iron(III) transport system substrate-binding protein